MKISEVVDSFSSSDVEQLVFEEKFVNKVGDIIGVSFSVDDGEGHRFCFALSKEIFNTSTVFGKAFASEIKNSTKESRVSVARDDTDIWCARIEDCIEKRDSNFDWMFERGLDRELYTLINGGKYSRNDVIIFDVVQNMLDALEVCRAKRS